MYNLVAREGTQALSNTEDGQRLTHERAMLKNSKVVVSSDITQAQQVNKNFSAAQQEALNNHIGPTVAIVDREAVPRLGVGKGPVGYIHDKNGEKIPVPYQIPKMKDGKYVKDKNGNIILEKNPDMQGFMTINDYNNWFNKYSSFQRDENTGMYTAQQYITPSMYKSNEGMNDLRTELDKAANTYNKKFVQTLSAAAQGYTGQEASLVTDKLGGTYTESITDNMNQLNSAVSLAWNALSQQGKDQLLSQYYEDYENGSSIMVYDPSNETLKPKLVKDVTSQQYIFAKASGLVLPRRSKQMTISSSSKTAGPDNPRNQMNNIEALFSPEVNTIDTTVPVLSNISNSDDATQVHIEFVSAKAKRTGSSGAVVLNKLFGINPNEKRLDLMKDITLDNQGGLLTPWGTIVNPADTGPLRAITTTGDIVFGPAMNYDASGFAKYHNVKQLDNGRVVYENVAESNQFANNTITYNRQAYVGVKVLMKGDAVKKSLTIVKPDVDKLIKKNETLINLGDSHLGDDKNEHYQKFNDLAQTLEDWKQNKKKRIATEGYKEKYNTILASIIEDNEISQDDKDVYFGEIGMYFNTGLPKKRKTIKAGFFGKSLTQADVNTINKVYFYHGGKPVSDLRKISDKEYYSMEVFVPVTSNIFYDSTTNKTNWNRMQSEINKTVSVKNQQGNEEGRKALFDANPTNNTEKGK